MRLPESVIESIEQELGCQVESVTPVGGGCISNASRVATDLDTYFLKWAEAPAGVTFVAEGNGLAALASVASSLVVPRPIIMRDADAGAPGLLLMDWIGEGSKNAAFWDHLGAGLARLHGESTDPAYGFEHDNFIGRLPQENKPCTDWVRFFVERRLLPQVDMARNRGCWVASWNRGLEGLLKALPAILPSEPHPSLVHGDLWAGNILATGNGGAAVVDPAVYRGDREVDLAMTELFGGFSSRFYEAYTAAWPLEGGYDRRRDVYNLYHLLNHLNHFGSSYAGQVASVLHRFG